MTLDSIKTLQDVARDYNIPFPTLQSRLISKSIDMIEGIDYKRLGQRMPTILSPSGIKKITKNEEEVLSRELIEQNGIYKIYKVITKTKIKYELCENTTLCLSQKDGSLESILEIWEHFKENGTIII